MDAPEDQEAVGFSPEGDVEEPAGDFDVSFDDEEPTAYEAVPEMQAELAEGFGGDPSPDVADLEPASDLVEAANAEGAGDEGLVAMDTVFDGDASEDVGFDGVGELGEAAGFDGHAGFDGDAGFEPAAVEAAAGFEPAAVEAAVGFDPAAVEAADSGTAEELLTVGEETGEVSLDEFEVWDTAGEGMAGDSSSDASDASDFFSAHPTGVGLYRRSFENPWQPSVNPIDSQPAGEMFAASAGLPAPASLPRPDLDPGLRVVGADDPSFQPELVLLTDATPHVAVSDVSPEPSPQFESFDIDGDDVGEDDVGEDDVGEEDLDMGSLADDEPAGDGPEEFVSVETGSEIDISGEDFGGGETQAVEMPPFEDDADHGIDVEL